MTRKLFKTSSLNLYPIFGKTTQSNKKPLYILFLCTIFLILIGRAREILFSGRLNGRGRVKAVVFPNVVWNPSHQKAG